MRIFRRLVPCFLIVALLPVSMAFPAGKKDDGPKTKTDVAIEKGVAWLLAEQKEDGSWPGYEGRYGGGTTALSLLALLKSGLDRKDNAIEKGFDHLRSLPLSRTPNGLGSVYSVSVTILALEAAYEGNSTDRYGQKRTRIRGRDNTWMKQLHRYLLDNAYRYEGEPVRGRDAEPSGYRGKKRVEMIAWRYPGPASNSPSPWDNSNTQYALLALKACSRSGISTDKEIWRAVVEHFLATQDKEGDDVNRVGLRNSDAEYDALEFYDAVEKDVARPWRYVIGEGPGFSNPRGSMVTVGVASLVICRSELFEDRVYKKEHQEAVDQSVRDGIAWLDRNWTLEQNPGSGPFHHYYYLYGIERVGQLAKIRNIGRNAWYEEGEKYLLANQQADGHWEGTQFGEQEDVVDTCFALLFLKRGTGVVAGDSYQVGPEK